VKEYTVDYHVERNHQGLDNRLVEEPPGVVDMNFAVVRHERLGGVLNYYERRAAFSVGRVLAHYGASEFLASREERESPETQHGPNRSVD